MNVKKIVGTVISLGGIIGTGILLFSGQDSKNTKQTIETVTKEEFGGVLMETLTSIAKSVNSKSYIVKESDSVIKYVYPSGRGHWKNETRFAIDKVTKELIPLLGGAVLYPGQRSSYANTFQNKVNEKIQFK